MRSLAARRAKPPCSISRAILRRAPCRDKARAAFRGGRAAADLVDALAKVFRDSDGDLALVSTALIENDRAWSTPRPKFATRASLCSRRSARSETCRTILARFSAS